MSSLYGCEVRSQYYVSFKGSGTIAIYLLEVLQVSIRLFGVWVNRRIYYEGKSTQVTNLYYVSYYCSVLTSFINGFLGFWLVRIVGISFLIPYYSRKVYVWGEFQSLARCYLMVDLRFDSAYVYRQVVYRLLGCLRQCHDSVYTYGYAYDCVR